LFEWFSIIYALKVEMTKYDELEEVHAELKLKQLLWDSIDKWDNLMNTWMQV
jgi:dynein heavy chain